MKAVLLLCLLAFISCEKDIIDIGKCIYKAPKVQELISDVIVAIATKDYSKLLPKLKESIPELIQIVLGCLVENKAIEENKLESIIPTLLHGCPTWIACENRCADATCRANCSKLPCFGPDWLLKK